MDRAYATVSARRPWPRSGARAGGWWPRTHRRWTRFSWPGPGHNPSRRTFMHSPAAALAWELWRRHRARLMTIVGLVLAFALLYPKLCALAGFNPDSADALDEIVNKFAPLNHTQPSALGIVQVLYVLSLACGPVATMVLTLLSLAWIFTLRRNSTRKPRMQWRFRRGYSRCRSQLLFCSGGLCWLGRRPWCVLYEVGFIAFACLTWRCSPPTRTVLAG